MNRRERYQLIRKCAAKAFGVPLDQVSRPGKGKNTMVTRARQAEFLIAKKVMRVGITEHARLAGFHRKTVLYGIKKASERCRSDFPTRLLTEGAARLLDEMEGRR